jgi:hypothetical protein
MALQPSRLFLIRPNERRRLFFLSVILDPIAPRSCPRYDGYVGYVAAYDERRFATVRCLDSLGLGLKGKAIYLAIKVVGLQVSSVDGYSAPQ